jgi:hypothetical protein
MRIYILYLIIVPTMFLTGSLYLYSSYFNTNILVNKYKKVFKKMINDFDNSMSNEEIDVIFKNSGLKMKYAQYNIIRHIIIMFFLATTIYNHFIGASNMLFGVILIAALYLLSSPIKTIMKKKMPFFIILDAFKKSFNKRKNMELFRLFSQLNNIIKIKGYEKITSTYLISELMKYSKITKNIFKNTLVLWYKNDRNNACNYFSESINTKYGKELAGIFLKIDRLTPADFKSQINVLKKAIDEERLRYRMNENEAKGNVLFALAVTPIFLIILNYIMFFISFYLSRMLDFK